MIYCYCWKSYRTSNIFKQPGTIVLLKNVAGSIANFTLISPQHWHTLTAGCFNTHTQLFEFDYVRLALLACSVFQLDLFTCTLSTRPHLLGLPVSYVCVLSQGLKTTVVSKPRQVCTPRWTLERSQHFPTRWELNYQFASCLERYHTTPAGLAWALQINSRPVDLNHKAQVPHILKPLKSSAECYFYFRKTHFSHTIQFGVSIKHGSDRIWRNGSWVIFWGLQHYRW